MERREKYVATVEEFNEILRVVAEYTVIEYGPWARPNSRSKCSPATLVTHSFVEDKKVYIEVTTKYYEYAVGNSNKFVPCTYIFRKDGDYKVIINPAIAYATLQKYYPAPDVSKWDDMPKTVTGSFVYSAKPILGYNEKYDNGGKGREDFLYVYDLNTAYGWAMSGQIPDTSYIAKRWGTVGKGQVGFMTDDDCSMRKEGEYADFVFDLMDSPYKPFAEKYFKMKSEAKTPAEKAKAKAMLVYSVGCLQRHNPFIRAYIVYTCNNYIKSLIDEDTVMWNTDAIYSLRPRDDLDIGTDIGQFKVEHEGLIRHKGLNYQIVDTEEVHYRGVSKKWFKKGYNILTDDVPPSGNEYFLNRETLQMEEIADEIYD